jgi:O-antigen/teichoic acid export membrane protein
MDELFERFTWSATESRYKQLQFIPVNKISLPKEAFPLSPTDLEAELQDEDEGEPTAKTEAIRIVERQWERAIAQQTTMKLAIPEEVKERDKRAIGQQATKRVVPPHGLSLPGNHVQARRPETFAFDIKPTDKNGSSELDVLDTIPMLVLKDISKRQGPSASEMKSEISQTAGSAAYVSIGNIGGSILKYGSNLLIQRGFGAAAFGLYTLAMSVATLILAIFNLGLDDAMLRYIAIYRAKKQMASMRGLVLFCTGIAGLSGILGAIVMVYTAPFLATVKHSPELAPLLVLMAPMVPLLCLQTVWSSGLQGLKEFKWRVLLQRILMPLLFILLLIVTAIFFHTLIAIVIATVIYGLASTVLSFYIFFKRISTMLKPGAEKYEVRDWLGFAAPNFLTSIVDTVLSSIDTLLLAFFAISNVAIGQYAASMKISGFIAMPLVSFGAMFAPMIAELHSQGEHQKLEAMFHIVTKWTITFSLPIFGIATLFSVSLLGISGPQFVAAWPLVIAFSVGSMINVGTGLVGYILLMTGHTKISFLNSLVAVIVDVILGIILTPRYGAMGVAIATGAAVSVVNIMKLLQVRLLVKMLPYQWDVIKPLGAGLISGIITGGLLYLLSLYHLSLQISRYHISFDLFLVPVFLAMYVGLLLLFKIGPEDKIVLDMLRKKLKGGKKNKK